MEPSPSREAASCAATQDLPASYETRKFITLFTSGLHWSLFWIRSTQFIPFHCISPRAILILSNHIRSVLPSGLFHFGLPHSNIYAFLFSPIRATYPAHLILLRLTVLIILNWRVQVMKPFVMHFYLLSCYFILFRSLFSPAPCS
jgi:hypothetical protein